MDIVSVQLVYNYRASSDPAHNNPVNILTAEVERCLLGYPKK
jgi:hypothetical protein